MREIKIDTSLKYFENTQRVCDEETTLLKTKKVIPQVGITRVAKITDLDRVGIPVYSTIRPSAMKGAISIYSGKGATDTQAKISAIMEGVERCLAEPIINNNNNNNNNIIESYENLVESYNTLNPNKLLLPSPLAPNTILEWISGLDLLNNMEILVPANAVYHPYNPSIGVQLFRTNTNGLAAGNVIEEAILHGLLEVIERDALSIAELTRNPGKEIILTEEDGINYELLKKFEDNGIVAKLWLLNSDVNIPTVVAALDDVVLKDSALLVMGAGAHLKPEIAVSRALTEAAQSRVVQIHGAREDTDREAVVRTIGYERLKRLNKYWYADSTEKITLCEIKDKSCGTPAENIQKTLDCLKGIAENAIIVNLSREGVDIPVIRAIIPTFELYTLDRERVGKRFVKSAKRNQKRKKKIKK